MSTAITLQLSDPALHYVQQQAEQLGTSVEGWLERELELQQKMQQHAEAIFAERSKPADPQAWRNLMTSIPANPPLPGDELPEGYQP